MKAITFLKTFCLVAILVCSANFTYAQAARSGADAIIGTWMVPEKDAKVEIYKCGNEYCGKIVWLETDRKDTFNPDASLQSRSLNGVKIMSGMKYDAGDNEWNDGTIYNSRNGKTYSGYMQLQKDGKLFMKGYVYGMRWLGKSNVWTRVD